VHMPCIMQYLQSGVGQHHVIKQISLSAAEHKVRKIKTTCSSRVYLKFINIFY